MTRLPIRVRLTLAFALAMAVVLAAMGAFVYSRVGAALESSIDQGLRTQETESISHLESGGSLGERDSGDTTLAQLFTPGGRVVRTTDETGQAPLVDPDDLVGGRRLMSTRLPHRDEDWRLLIQPVELHGHPYVLALARSLEPREETLSHLFHGFAIAGPLALLVASLAGYGLAAASLRPVEAMRRRAQAISASTPGRRLPVPRGRDEVVRLAETLNEMLARLESAFARERRFVADASHELRTPLALLRAELELALRRQRTPEELAAAIRSAAEETERLSRLAEDLLLIARVDQGALPLRRVELAPDDLLRRVARRLEPRAAAHGRAIAVDDTPAGIGSLDADPDRLEQALGNLVENALLHGRGTVTLSTRRRDGLVELHVTDDGAGFPEEFLPHAFDRFSRADEGRSQGGTGLGLSIVQLVARAHAGEVGARNSPGGGADVWIAVPAAAAEPRRRSLSTV